MRVITCNVNGIRSAQKKGFFEWVITQDADFICLQETKAQLNLLDSELLHIPGYLRYCSDAEKTGYSGVAVYAKQKPDKVKSILGFDCADKEGRYIELEYPNFSIISLYLPSGTSGDHRQAEKYRFMEKFELLLKEIIKHKKSCIICGDWNIAHKIIDIKNWKANQKNSGFLPAERAWFTKLLDEIGWVDAFRVANQEADQYTWWSNRGAAYEKNVGWRIDYQMITPDWKDRIQAASIYKKQKFSDHAPLILDYLIFL
jgi:exodeoxyribonuclease-3